MHILNFSKNTYFLSCALLLTKLFLSCCEFEREAMCYLFLGVVFKDIFTTVLYRIFLGIKADLKELIH